MQWLQGQAACGHWRLSSILDPTSAPGACYSLGLGWGWENGQVEAKGVSHLVGGERGHVVSGVFVRVSSLGAGGQAGERCVGTVMCYAQMRPLSSRQSGHIDGWTQAAYVPGTRWSRQQPNGPLAQPRNTTI